MAVAGRTNNTEQVQRFIDNLWEHQQKNEFCDFTLTTNNTVIECHQLVLSSASSYFSQLLCDSDYTNIIDVTPLPEHILRTVVAFMYNSDYVIDDENVIELLKFSKTWNLDILAKLCVEYMNDNATINNACRFYNFALDNVDQHKSQIVNKFIRQHFTSLHESGQLIELSLKNFTTIIEHDEINVRNEDVIFSSAVQIINQQTSVEDINRCLELIRFPHTSGDFLVKVILNHPLMKEPPRNKCVSEAILYQIKKTSTPEVKPPRCWTGGIYYLGYDHCMYRFVSKAYNNERVKMMEFPEWAGNCSSVGSHRERVVVVGGFNERAGEKHALLLDMTLNPKLTELPDLPEETFNSSVALFDNDVYVVGGYNKRRNCLRSVYYLSLGSDAWQIKKSMSHAVRLSLVVQHQQCIYVLGGVDDNVYLQSSVSQYNIEDDTWKQCSNMPVPCSSLEAGVVVHEDRIKVITVDTCLMYVNETDTWAVKTFTRIGGNGTTINAFIRKGQIWAALQKPDGTHSMMSYDDVDNVWKTEREGIDIAGYTGLFC